MADVFGVEPDHAGFQRIGVITALAVITTRALIRALALSVVVPLVVLALVATIGVAFIIEIFLGQPDWGGIVRGFVPSLPDSAALYISIGILGATVMPHNLYLHSSLVQTRKIGKTHEDIRQAIVKPSSVSVLSGSVASIDDIISST